jgi:lipopolysaccharide transport system permease protein
MSVVEAAADHGETTEWIVHEPGSLGRSGVRALWRARELLALLAWRDLKVRYKQTALGALWALLQPALMMVIFTVIFGRLVQMPSDGAPYPLFVLAALIPWQLFASTLGSVTNSLVDNERLLTKVAFPRLVIPFAAAVTGLVDGLIASVLLVMAMALFGVGPGVGIVLLPFLGLIAVAAGLGLGLSLAALNVRYRDVRYVIPFLLQVLLFLSPVVYSASIVPERWRLWYSLNPIVGIIDGFRWAVLPGAPAPWMTLSVSLLGLTVVWVVGVKYFQHVERTLADLV